MVKKQVIFLLAFIFLFTLVSAENIGIFKLDKDIEIYQECNNCTECNFTRVKYPNGTSFLTNRIALQDGTYYYYNIEGGNISEVGDYSYCYSCGNTEEKLTGCIDFTVTYNGHELNIERAMLYIGITFFLVLFLTYVFWLRGNLPENKVDDDGYVISFSNLYWARPVLMALGWVLLLGIVFMVSNISIAYLPFPMFGDFLFMIFRLMFWLTILAVPIWFIWLLLYIFRHNEMKRLLERGVEFGGSNII